MSNLKKEIFIASRFEEFKEIRLKLNESINNYKFMESIDLNDNKASPNSPLAESLFHVRKSEIVVLLVGETYGTIPNQQTKSFTHLEYIEAIKESSNTRVLVYCIGESYNEKYIEYSSDDNMKQWQIELEENHRLSKFSDPLNYDYIVEQIMINLLTSLYDLNPNESLDLGQDEDFYIDIIKDDEEIDILREDNEVNYLDTKKAENEGINLINHAEDSVEGFELLKIPGKIASIEQKKEAQYAIEIKDYYTAIKHLRKALELRPLDFESNYWLAKLYVTSAKKSLFYEIEEYLLRAAKIAENNNEHYKASHCYQMIVQASIFSDKKNEGNKYISLAEDLTPSFARLHYEKSKFFFNFNEIIKGKNALKQAINIKIDILRDIANDPFFTKYKASINELKVELKNSLYKSCFAVSSQTNTIRGLFGLEAISIDLKRYSIYDLWKKTRYSFLHQYKIIVNQINLSKHNLISYKDNQIIWLKNDLIQKESDLNNEKSISLKNINLETNTKISNLKREHNINTKAIEQKYQNKKNKYNNGIVISLILALASFFKFYTMNIENIYMILPSIILLISTYFIYKTIDTTKVKNELLVESKKTFNIFLDELNLKNKSALSDEQNKYSSMIYLLNEDYNNQIKDLLEEIKELKTMHKNISKSFYIFEEQTVTMSSSKIVPFRSLKNSSIGAIVRVTPSSYDYYSQNDISIEIAEDFPEYLDIKPINPENISFLVKVMYKDKNVIRLSRYQAYDSAYGLHKNNVNI